MVHVESLYRRNTYGSFQHNPQKEVDNTHQQHIEILMFGYRRCNTSNKCFLSQKVKREKLKMAKSRFHMASIGAKKV
jgi:hypothetical protein